METKNESLIGGYSICSNEWALDKEIKDELGLLLIISSLTGKTGYCFASNEYLSNLFDVTSVTISRRLKKLEKKGYIYINYTKNGCTITSRKMFINIDTMRVIRDTINTDDNQRLTQMLKAINTDDNGTINTDVKDNNISINNINSNNIYIPENKPKKTRSKKEFVPPTEDEVKAYCDKMGYKVNAHDFCDWYTDPDTGKWIDKNGEAVKNWKLKLKVWNNNNNNKSVTSKSYYQSALAKSGSDDFTGEVNF